jgi:hypothetical protein
MQRSLKRFAPEQERVARNVLFERAAKPAT